MTMVYNDCLPVFMAYKWNKTNNNSIKNNFLFELKQDSQKMIQCTQACTWLRLSAGDMSLIHNLEFKTFQHHYTDTTIWLHKYPMSWLLVLLDLWVDVCATRSRGTPVCSFTWLYLAVPGCITRTLFPHRTPALGCHTTIWAENIDVTL